MSDTVKYQWIDAAKGFAMLGIMLIHVAQRVAGIPNGVIFMIAFGAMGVQLFFMMSAYTACVSCQKSPNVQWLSYVFRRFSRLFPVYWFGIVLYGVWSCLAQTFSWPVISGSFSSYTIVNTVLNVALINTFYLPAQNSVVPGGWSISCIAVFYLAFPWLYRMLSRGLYCRVATLLFFNFCVVAVLLARECLPKEFVYFSIVNQLSVFVIGMVIFFKPQVLMACVRMKFGTLSFAVIGGVLLIALAMKTVGQSYLYRHILVAFCFIPFIAILQKCEGRLPFFLLNLGKRSYPVFVIHFIFAWGLCGALDHSFACVSPFIRLPAYYGLTVFCSYNLAGLIDRYYERPILGVQQRALQKRNLK